MSLACLDATYLHKSAQSCTSQMKGTKALGLLATFESTTQIYYDFLDAANFVGVPCA